MILFLLFAATTVAIRYDITNGGIRNKSFTFLLRDPNNPKEVNLKNSRSQKAEQIFNGMEDGSRIKRQVLKDYANLNTTWRNGVFYTFNTTDPVIKRVFKLGAQIWHDATCVDFIEDDSAPDKVVVVNGSESVSGIGRLGGDQTFSLGDDITVGTAVHELGHILGFFHTMQRYDRNSYVEINIENINPYLLIEFEKIGKAYAAVYGLSYDYGSVMHYGELSCSFTGLNTMTALNSLYQKTMGSEIISFSDVYMINEHYECNERCNKSTSAKCANEGYPHPRNCSTCICPSGYGGTLCDRRPPGCGADLVAKNEKQTVTYRLGSGSGFRDLYDFCNYMIKAPGGKKVEVEVVSVSPGYEDAGCTRGGVEVKAQDDQKLTGYRFCSSKGSEGPVISNSSRVPVILFNRFSTMEATFKYRYFG